MQNGVSSEFPLEAELYLPCVGSFDQPTVRVQTVIRADENCIRVIGEIVNADAKKENAMIFPPFKTFCDAKIDVEEASLIERIPSESVRAGRNWIRASSVEVCCRKRVYRS